MTARPMRVAVILGDPRLPYLYAVDGKFGEVEMQVLADFKAALNELSGYEFRFLDDHSGKFRGQYTEYRLTRINV